MARDVAARQQEKEEGLSQPEWHIYKQGKDLFGGNTAVKGEQSNGRRIMRNEKNRR